MRAVNVSVIDTNKGPALHPRNSPGKLTSPLRPLARHKPGNPRHTAGTGPLWKASQQTSPTFRHLPE